MKVYGVFRTRKDRPNDPAVLIQLYRHKEAAELHSQKMNLLYQEHELTKQFVSFVEKWDVRETAYTVQEIP